jgi:hypothetical protein
MRQFLLFTVSLVSVLLFALPADAQTPPPVTLRSFLESKLQKSPGNGHANTLLEICPIDSDPIAFRVFSEYGAMFAGEGIAFPPRCIFSESREVDTFHDQVKTKELTVNGVPIVLQNKAAESLINAVEEAATMRLRITPLDGGIAGKRTFEDTLRIWNSRFFPALEHWVAKGKIDRTAADAAVNAKLPQQIARVIEWEEKGYYFSTGFSKSIFNSVAPPGTSQHLSMIAFDVVESSNPKVRAIMNKHGWFQTIKTDEPHFTYLGVDEAELSSRGLKQFVRSGQVFWIPVV